MATVQISVAPEVGNQSGNIGTSEFAVSIAIARHIQVSAGRIHEAAVSGWSTYTFKVTDTVSNIAAQTLAITVNITY